MFGTLPIAPSDILLNTDVVLVTEGFIRYHKGDKVMVTTSFYGGEQKGIVVSGPWFDRFFHRTTYEVRITSRRRIYGGNNFGDLVSKTEVCLRNRDR
jgi:hypothetical protein